jgi:hypothetical protein
VYHYCRGNKKFFVLQGDFDQVFPGLSCARPGVMSNQCVLLIPWGS